MGKVHIFDHPLIHHKVSYLRDKNTTSREFRSIVEELALLMAYEVTADLKTYEVDVETPLATAHCQRVEEENIVIIPILRAGLGMTSGFQRLLPSAKVGHIGMARNEETHEPDVYYYRMPEGIENAICIVVDPMLATGGSARDSIDFLKKNGVKNIKFVGLVAADRGIETLQTSHPDVDIYVAERDAELNDKAYITPGLGDAGDRIFGTC